MNHIVYRDALKAVAKVLKAHFTNLTVEQTLTIAGEILDALDGTLEVS